LKTLRTTTNAPVTTAIATTLIQLIMLMALVVFLALKYRQANKVVNAGKGLVSGTQRI
jgi:hypothetical protein